MKNRISGMKRSPARDSIRYQAGSTRNRSLLRYIQPIVVWLLAAVLIGLGGCRKDVMNDINSIEQSPVAENLTVDKAKKWWSSQVSLSFRSEDDSLTTNVSILWDRAYQILYREEETVVIVPVYWDDIMKMHDRGNVVLAIYNHPDNSGLEYKWLGYYAPYHTYPRPIAQFNVNDYSGFFFELDKRGYIQHVLRVQNGQINGYHPGASGSSRLSEIDFRDDEDFPRRRRRNRNNEVECPWDSENTEDVYYNPGVCNDGFGSFFQWLGGLINSIFSGPHTNANNSPPYVSPFYNFGPGFNPGHESGPNNSSSLNQHFNNQIFHWTAEHAQLLEQFRIRNNINLPSHVLMLIVNPSCFANSEMSDVTEDADEDAIYDQCIFGSMITWINERASLSPEEYNDLVTNSEKLEHTVAFLLHLEASGFSRSEIEGFMDRWFENYTEWTGLTEDEEGVICCNPPVVINNGITLANMTTPANSTLFSGLIKVGYSVGTYPDDFDNPIDDPEDIRSGTNADDRGIYLDKKPAVVSRTGSVIVPARPYTDAELFDFMTPLFMATTHCDNRSIAFLFKEQFRTNTERGKFFYHRPLSDKVMTHPVMKNYMKSFGKQLNDKLSTSNGLMISQAINMGTERPQFNKNCSDQNTWYDRFHGYQILINDTQAVDIYLIPGSYIYDANTKVWRGRFTFVVTDHFGLDKQDAIDYQWFPLGDGFSAWWRLQHTRGYKPFRTRIIVSADIQGKLN